MCIIKVMSDPYKNCSSIYALVNYALTDKRTRQRVRFYGGYNVDALMASDQIVLVKQYYHKVDNRQMRHFSVSFEDYITPYDAYILGYQIAAYYGKRYQIVFGVHEDKKIPHIHFVFNTVSFVDGLKYSDAYTDLSRLKAYVNEVYNAYLNG